MSMTTTFDDADLFSDAFTGFRGVTPSRRRSRTVSGLALATALMLVVGALAWVRLGQQTFASAAADPVTLVPVLAQQQRAADVIAVSERADAHVYSESTRLLLAGETVSYYVATTTGDQICLVAIPVGDLARTACGSTAGARSALRIDDVALVPTGATAPTGWHEAAANVFVKS
ncbi:hypothetical protein [Cellulomonas sp. URHE0023]|uniref:hypothetical protein n=1 Tax=Cellulomonas sp. URHE0023 TaxID=1380354 RepID=UPI0012DCBD37|nr:hypothetical protein [Cellulomonas sp. URHE0023]